MLNKLAYIVIREDLNHPIIQSQIIDVVTNIIQNKSEHFTLVWFYRIDYLFRSEKRIQILKKDLRRKGIRLVTIPFASLGFPVSWYLLPFVLPQWLVGLLWIYITKKKSIFHCRSYHAALAGVILKFALPIKIIFDPRSPFPEENVAAKRWKTGGINYPFWKKAEMILCHSSDAIIATSTPFLETLKKLSPNSRIELIPNNYPISFTHTSINEIGQENSLGILKLCYVGSFGHWNKADSYLRFLEYAEKNTAFTVSAKFIVQSSSLFFLEDSLKQIKINNSRLTILSSPQEEILSHLSDCTVGMQIMPYPDDRLSIKFVEYLAAGLPVIVSENVHGAADIVNKYGVGFIINNDFSNADEALQFISDVSEDRALWHDKCQNLAKQLFSTNAVSKQLLNLYETL